MFPVTMEWIDISITDYLKGRQHSSRIKKSQFWKDKLWPLKWWRQMNEMNMETIQLSTKDGTAKALINKLSTGSVKIYESKCF